MNMRSADRKVLLIIPPLDLPTHPYPAVPQLASWLKSKGYTAKAVDLNIAFIRWALQSERVKRGLRLGEADEQSLNSMPNRDRHFLDTVQRGEKALREFAAPADLLLDFRRHKSLSDAIEKIEDILNLSFLPTYPEEIFTSVSMQYRGFADIYSSTSILSSMKKESLFDAFCTETVPKLMSEKYSFIGISMPFEKQIEPVIRLCRAIKQEDCGTKIIIGGAAVGIHLSAAKEPKLFDFFDALIAGDGEYPLENLLTQTEWQNGDYSLIPGAIWRQGGKILRNPISSPTPLEEIPLPDKTLFDKSDYLSWPHESLYRLSLSRGCTWGHCAFCNVAGSGLFPNQRLSASEAAAKVLAFSENAGGIAISDDEANPAAVYEAAKEAIKHKRNLNWSIQTRVHPSMTAEWANTLRRSGCRKIYLGVESFCDRVLRSMNKPTNEQLTDRVLEELAWGGLPVTAYMIAGFPGETEEEAVYSFNKLLNHIKKGTINTAYYNLFTIVPKSPTAQAPQNYGITKTAADESQDLNPTHVCFECSGMSRERTIELQKSFEKILAHRRGK